MGVLADARTMDVRGTRRRALRGLRAVGDGRRMGECMGQASIRPLTRRNWRPGTPLSSAIPLRHSHGNRRYAGSGSSMSGPCQCHPTTHTPHVARACSTGHGPRLTYVHPTSPRQVRHAYAQNAKYRAVSVRKPQVEQVNAHLRYRSMATRQVQRTPYSSTFYTLQRVYEIQPS
jgi:hypothetical protein